MKVRLKMYVVCGVLLILLAEINSEDEEYVGQEVSMLCGTKQLIAETCYYTEISDDVPYLDERKSPFHKDSIFFIETSCRGGLDIRQECAIEATARAHPDREVNVLFAGPVMTRSEQYYNNVNLYRLNLSRIYKRTPLKQLQERQFRCLVHRWPDVLRFIILYKYGGIYLDLNVIVAKSFDYLPENENFAGQIDENFVGSGLLAFSPFDPRGIGQTILNSVLRVYKKHFMEKKMSHNSIDILTKVLKKICKTNKVDEMTVKTCEGFEVYDSFYFYPVHYKSWKYYFEHSTDQIPSEPYAFYVWNYLLHNETLYHDSIYGRLIHAFCPQNQGIVYQLNHLLLKSNVGLVPKTSKTKTTLPDFAQYA